MNRRRTVLSAVVVAAAAFAVPTAPPAAGATDTLFALEVFEPEAGEVADPLCNNTEDGVQPAPPAALPAGTVSVAVVQGSLPDGRRSVRRCQFRVSIGTQSFTLYKSADTRIANRRLLRRGVRVVAARDEQTGVLVAERIVGRNGARNEIERAFLATVAVVERGPAEWTTTEIGGSGREFTFDVASAEVEAPADTTSPVAVEFDTVAPVPD